MLRCACLKIPESFPDFYIPFGYIRQTNGESRIENYLTYNPAYAGDNVTSFSLVISEFL